MVNECQFALLLVHCKEAAQRDGLRFKPIDLRWKVIVYVFNRAEELRVVQSGEPRELVSGITILDLWINLFVFHLGDEGIFRIAYVHVAYFHAAYVYIAYFYVADVHVAYFHVADVYVAYFHVAYCHVASELFSDRRDRLESGRSLGSFPGHEGPIYTQA